jgi:hypothetical protein
VNRIELHRRKHVRSEQATKNVRPPLRAKTQPICGLRLCGVRCPHPCHVRDRSTAPVGSPRLASEKGLVEEDGQPYMVRNLLAAAGGTVSELHDSVLAMVVCAICGRLFGRNASTVAWAVVDGERRVVCPSCAEGASPNTDDAGRGRSITAGDDPKQAPTAFVLVANGVSNTRTAMAGILPVQGPDPWRGRP